MKPYLSLLILVLVSMFLPAQNYQLRPGLEYENHHFDPFPSQTENFGASQTFPKSNQNVVSFEDEISIITVGGSANAYSYGWGGGQRSIINVDNELGIIANLHRMGGPFDPGPSLSSGDLGFDLSLSNGQSWQQSLEFYIADTYIPGVYCGPIDVARYPSSAVFNPAGNTNREDAYLAYFAPIMDCSNDIPWGGYAWGRVRLGDVSDSTKHLLSSDTAAGFFQYVPDGFTAHTASGFWAVDYNYNLFSNIWLEELIINHGVWNEETLDFNLQQFLLACPTEFSAFIPPCSRIEFSPDGQTGYIVVLSDNGVVEISTGHSFYPVLYRTEDAGQTWSEPVPVALAGESGIGAVQQFLSDEELSEIFSFNVPPRNEIRFTTAFDFDLSVDNFGNPHLALVVGLSGPEDYSIITETSASTGNKYLAAFLLSSMNKGEEDSWIGYELGRLKSFRGFFDEDGFYEDNRIQIARSRDADKMFVAWNDTEPDAADENIQPDIHARGIDIINHTLTINKAGQPMPDNVTGTSPANDSAYCFAMGNYVLDNGSGIYAPVFIYQDFEHSFGPVVYKHVSGFNYIDTDFQVVSVNENLTNQSGNLSGWKIFPNPAKHQTTIDFSSLESCTANIFIYNFFGEQVLKISYLSCQAGTNSVVLDLSILKPGIYFCAVEAAGNIKKEKLAISNH